MRARLIIEIKKIKSKKVDSTFVEKTPGLIKSTEKTINELCKRIDDYFYQYKIHTITKLEKLEIGR
jgi:hypothetical protein